MLVVFATKDAARLRTHVVVVRHERNGIAEVHLVPPPLLVDASILVDVLCTEALLHQPGHHDYLVSVQTPVLLDEFPAQQRTQSFRVPSGFAALTSRRARLAS